MEAEDTRIGALHADLSDMDEEVREREGEKLFALIDFRPNSRFDPRLAGSNALPRRG